MGTQPFVAVMMGSKSDWDVMQHAVSELRALDLAVEVRVHSAHRTPQATERFVKEACSRGVVAFIAAAGMAAHLAGVVAAHSVKPVIGVPLASSELQGLDALLATVQMPSGIPVATMAIGRAGAKNAAIFAAQIAGVADPAVAARLQARREAMAQAVLEANEALQDELQQLSKTA